MAQEVLRFWRTALVSARTAVVKYSSKLSSYRDQEYDIVVPLVNVNFTAEDTDEEQVAATLSTA